MQIVQCPYLLIVSVPPFGSICEVDIASFPEAISTHIDVLFSNVNLNRLIRPLTTVMYRELTN